MSNFKVKKKVKIYLLYFPFQFEVKGWEKNSYFKVFFILLSSIIQKMCKTHKNGWDEYLIKIFYPDTWCANMLSFHLTLTKLNFLFGKLRVQTKITSKNDFSIELVNVSRRM
jgi:ABC-type sulfate transport system permease subunit